MFPLYVQCDEVRTVVVENGSIMPLSERKDTCFVVVKKERKKAKTAAIFSSSYQLTPRNQVKGESSHLLHQVLDDEAKCLDYLRMTPTAFRYLLSLCTADLKQQTTNFRIPVSPEEVVTLR